VVLVGGIYHADADKLLRSRADVVALKRPAPAAIAAAFKGAHSAVTQVLQALAGEQPPHLVNPEAWDAAMARLGRRA